MTVVASRQARELNAIFAGIVAGPACVKPARPVRYSALTQHTCSASASILNNSERRSGRMMAGIAVNLHAGAFISCQNLHPPRFCPVQARSSSAYAQIVIVCGRGFISPGKK